MKRIILILTVALFISCSTDTVDDTCSCTQTRIVYNADNVITNQTQEIFEDSCERDGEYTEASGNNGSLIVQSIDCN